MSAFRQRLFRQNSLDQDSPKFFLAKVSSFTVVKLWKNRQYWNFVYKFQSEIWLITENYWVLS